MPNTVKITRGWLSFAILHKYSHYHFLAHHVAEHVGMPCHTKYIEWYGTVWGRGAYRYVGGMRGGYGVVVGDAAAGTLSTSTFASAYFIFVSWLTSLSDIARRWFYMPVCTVENMTNLLWRTMKIRLSENLC